MELGFVQSSAKHLQQIVTSLSPLSDQGHRESCAYFAVNVVEVLSVSNLSRFHS